MGLAVDQASDQIGDVLLPGGGHVQHPAHLGEAPVDVNTEVAEVLPQLDKVLPQCIETGGCGDSEVADFGSDLSDIAVGRAGQYPCCCGAHTSLEIILTHSADTTGVMSAGVPLVSGSVDKGEKFRGSRCSARKRGSTRT